MLTETKNKYTVEDYMLLEEGAPFQLINFDLIMSPAPTHLHQTIITRLTQAILNHTDRSSDGGYFLVAPTDVFLDEGNAFQPDVIFISTENRKKIIDKKIDFGPDLCIEILSPSTAYYDIKHKKRMYEKFGVKEYIIIDPLEENAEIFRLVEEVFVLEETVNISDELVLQTITGFSVPLKKLFS